MRGKTKKLRRKGKRTSDAKRSHENLGFLSCENGTNPSVMLCIALDTPAASLPNFFKKQLIPKAMSLSTLIFINPHP